MEQILTELLKQAEEAHAIYERDQLNGERDDNWPEWYALFMAEKLTSEGYLIHRH